MTLDYDYGDYINGNDEHITGLIVKRSAPPVKPLMYRSKFRTLVQEEMNTNKFAHKTLGVMRVSLSAPNQFLRKNSGIRPERPQVNHKHYHRPDYQHKLPAWEPLRKCKSADKSNNSLTSTKNFEKENILGVMKKNQLSKSTIQKPMSNSSKPDTNKKILPRYLKHSPAKTKDDGKNTESRKSPIKHQTEIKPKKNVEEQSKGRYITPEERAELLEGMKKKWDELMKQFQTLPFLTDTPPKAKRKAKMEENLKQLEKDIDDIERHSFIYVYDDDNDKNKQN